MLLKEIFLSSERYHTSTSHDVADIARHTEAYAVVHKQRRGRHRLPSSAGHDLRAAAALGDLSIVQRRLLDSPRSLLAADENGWQAIHEAVRGGHTDVVRYLVEKGADLAAVTNGGGTPLWWANRLLPGGHSVIGYLQSARAPENEDVV